MDMTLKVMQIGAGGIGSFFIEEVSTCIQQLQLCVDLTIVDDDIVELNQIKYQNFSKEESGMNKAKALAKRYMNSGVQASTKRILKESDLNGYDVYVLCVDNDKTRKLVVEYCHKNNKEFLDIRATGRKVFCMPKETKLRDNLRFIDDDSESYSCQDKSDLAQGYIQKGHKVAAMIGVQMLLNIDRGHDNHLINLVI